MGFGIRLKVWGDYACFTRPEMKVERVSYDVITPSAARGILEAIYWKPQIRWVIDKITVLNPIVFDSIRRNELIGKIPESTVKSAMKGNEVNLHQITGEKIAQRSSLVLKNVEYLIDAHFEMTGKDAEEGDTAEKHYNIALRRIEKGQYFHHPYFGCREFPVSFSLPEGNEKSHYEGKEIDLGYMLWDIDFSHDATPVFYRPVMKDGVIRVCDPRKGGSD